MTTWTPLQTSNRHNAVSDPLFGGRFASPVAGVVNGFAPRRADVYGLAASRRLTKGTTVNARDVVDMSGDDAPTPA